MQTSIIRPGLLVSLKTTIRGGVNYQTQTIEPDHAEGSARVAEWRTRREITDAAEHASAIKARSAARTAIVRACCPSSFGLLCPTANEAALRDGISAAMRIADEFNRSAIYSRIDCYVITGRIADSDENAARAIGAEVRDLLDAMQRGIAAADPAAIRDAANRARSVSAMLSADARASVSAAIAEVRSVARDIVRRVEREGESAAGIVEGLQLRALDAARFAVLDIADDGATDAPADVQPIIAPAIDLPAAPTDALAGDAADDAMPAAPADDGTDDAAPMLAAAAPLAFPAIEWGV